MARKANSGSFTPGDPRAGRPKGTRNKTSEDARELCQKLIFDPEYQARLRERLIQGRLGPELEKMLWGYSFGAPSATPITPTDDFLRELAEMDGRGR